MTTILVLKLFAVLALALVGFFVARRITRDDFAVAVGTDSAGRSLDSPALGKGTAGQNRPPIYTTISHVSAGPILITVADRLEFRGSKPFPRATKTRVVRLLVDGDIESPAEAALVAAAIAAAGEDTRAP